MTGIATPFARSPLVATLTDTTCAIEVTGVLEALHRQLTGVGARDVGTTLTYGDHEVTVPLKRILAAPDS